MLVGMTSAFAATVTIQGQTTGGVINGHTFKAYKVLNGTWQGGVLTDLTSGDGVSWSAEMLTALNAIDGISGVTDGKTLGAALDGASEATGKAVAKVLKDYTVAEKAISVSNGGSLADGYYIIIDETTLGDNDVANAALLQVAGDTVTINVKTSTTTVDKEIDGAHDADSETTGNVKSNNGQVGDLVPYIITATVADTTYYDHYYFEMNDTLSSGLDISAATGDNAFSDYAVEVSCEAGDAEDTDGDGFKTLAAAKYTLTPNPTARTIQLVITDAKEFGGKQIRLSYKAKINDNAVVGTTGNPNEVTLKYTNSPDHSGDGEYDDDEWTSVTPKSVVITYVTGIKLLKVDTETPWKPLAGAVFSIDGTRAVSTVVTTKGFTADATGTYYKLTNGSYTETAPGGAIPNDQYDNLTTTYKATETTSVQTETSSVLVQGTTDASGYLKFNELGAGHYVIHEITAPNGYNLLENDIVFDIGFTGPTSVSTGTETCSWDYSNLTGADNVTFDSTEGVFSITVKNAKGQTLPSTGGIGTTLFYIGGGILVLAAVILLVTKRRMNAND